ncbi:MAG: hypothetical protein AAGB13_12230 [Cyanobacteria bacterium P01_F01_bin.33]
MVNGEGYSFYQRLSLSTYLQGNVTLDGLMVRSSSEDETLKIDSCLTGRGSHPLRTDNLSG